MIKLEKKIKKIVTKNMVIYAIIAIIIIVTIIRIFNLIIKPANTFLVENGKLSEEQSMQGYVIRDEEVIKGENYKNGMQKIKLEGEKVARGDAIFRYFTSGEEGLIKKINELDIKISQVLEQEQSSLYKADIKTIENSVQEKINNVYELNDMQKIKEYKQDINNYINKKAKIAGEYSPAGSYLKELITQRSTYENELNSGSEYITASKSGVVSYRVDGLEERLTPNNFAGLSKNLLEELNLKTGQMISTSEESGKIVNNYECYIACVLNIGDKELKVGDELKLRLANNQEIDSKVAYISDESESEKLIVFRIDKCVEELVNYRKISFDIIWWREQGLKVANDAIKTDDKNLQYVIRQRNKYTDKIYIKVLKQNENYSIIKNYTRSELLKTGLDSKEIERQSEIQISIYDEISL